jgi:hypothetical protein
MNRKSNDPRPEGLTWICMHGQLVAFALLGLACGPPKLGGDVDAGDGDAEEESSDSASSSSSSSSSESGTTETGTEIDTSDTDTSDTDTNESVGFVDTGDDFWVAECDSFAQDCPDGEKCVPYASSGGTWDALTCVPVMGNQAPGESCTYAGEVESTDDCDATSWCWHVNEEGMGTCHPFCTGTPDTPECPEASSCTISGDGVINICISNCDPTLQDCDEGLACYWANNGFNCIFTTQDIPPGEPCGFINDCVTGSGCTAEVLPSCAGSACCSPWCQLGAGDLPCEVLPGTTCVPFFEEDMAPPGYELVGVCIIQP